MFLLSVRPNVIFSNHLCQKELEIWTNLPLFILILQSEEGRVYIEQGSIV